MKFHISWILLTLISVIEGQRTILDEKFTGVADQFKKVSLQLLGSTGVNPEIRRMHQRMGKLQRHFSKSTDFFCNTTNSRSSIRPLSVHKLRPGDIDIIGAMGDSLTAASGTMAINILHVNIENRGMSFAIGGQANWRKILTLPNILKEFNPNLYGYSITDSFSTDRISKFNTAEPGAMSRDMPHQARNIVKRMRGDPKVNMTNDWKLITILIGDNDFCSDMCFYNDPENVVVRNHENDLVTTLRILRDNIPRLMVSVLPAPHLRRLALIKIKPKQCYYTHLFECPCLIGWRHKFLDFYTKIMDSWQAKDKEIIQRDEFNKEDFTVNIQPFTVKVSLPNYKNSTKTDFSYSSVDCFHLSQKGHARAANSLWNNMLQPNGEKIDDWTTEFEKFECPTEQRPYLATRVNSQQ